MPRCIIYSSITGNTRQLAEAMAHAEGSPLYSVQDAPNPERFSLLALGFWVRKGLPDERMLRFMESIRNTKVYLFGTLGAWPDSPHAERCIEETTQRLSAQGNTIIGHFLCQGRVNPRIVTASAQKGTHLLTPERAARLAEAERHPDAQDRARAAQTWLEHCQRLQRDGIFRGKEPL